MPTRVYGNITINSTELFNADMTAINASLLPVATDSYYGVVRVGTGLAVSSGVLALDIASDFTTLSTTKTPSVRAVYNYIASTCRLSSWIPNNIVSGDEGLFSAPYHDEDSYLVGQLSIAPEHSTSSTYSVGDLVTYRGFLYKCLVDVMTPGSLTTGNFVKATVNSAFAKKDVCLRQKTASLMSGTVTLSDDTVIYISNPSSATTFSFVSTGLCGSGAITFELVVVMPATVYALTFPSSVSWLNDEIPDMSTASKTYMLAFRSFDNGTTWVGNLQGSY